MSTDQINLPDTDRLREEQELLPLEQVQITNGLPENVKIKCRQLFEELLRKVILNEKSKL